MRLIIDSIKQAASIFWDDSIMLLGFNVVTFLSILPALIFYNLFIQDISIITSIINFLLFFPLVFFLFSLSYIVHDLGMGKAIKFKYFFQYIPVTVKTAFIWGGINFVAFFLFSWNMRFYAQFVELWAALMQLLLLSIAFIWFVLQLVMLPIYPKLKAPGFRLALRNALGILGRYPFPILVLIIMIVLLLVLTFFFQFAAIFFTFALVAVLLEGFVGEIIRNETEDEEEQPGIDVS